MILRVFSNLNDSVILEMVKRCSSIWVIKGILMVLSNRGEASAFKRSRSPRWFVFLF